jgi:hypothetical protein
MGITVIGKLRIAVGGSMDVTGPLLTLRRRWMLTLLLLLLTLVATVALAKKPGPYQSESQVVLLPSKVSAKAFGGNPYLSFGGSITLTADLVRREMMDPRTVLVLASQGFTSAYSVVDDPDTAGPVLDVLVDGSNEYSVEHTLNGATAEVSTKLTELQAGVKPADQITSLIVSSDPQPSLKLSKKARPLAVVLGIGLLFTIAIPQLVDAALSARRAARSGRPRRPVRPEQEFPEKTSRREASVPVGEAANGAWKPGLGDSDPVRTVTGSRSSSPPPGFD